MRGLESRLSTCSGLTDINAPRVCAPTQPTTARLGPPLGVEAIWEFQEFQELKTTQSNFKRRKRVAKIKRRQMFDRRAFILF